MKSSDLNPLEKIVLQIFSLIHHENSLSLRQLTAICFYTQSELSLKQPENKNLNFNFIRGSDFLSSNELSQIISSFKNNDIIEKKHNDFAQASYKVGIKGALLMRDLTVDPVVNNSLMAWIGFFHPQSDRQIESLFYKTLKMPQYEIGDRVNLIKLY